MQRAFQLASGPLYKAEKPVRNPLYTRFVKRFACAACGGTRDVDPCHTGVHAYGRKACDLRVIPLCRKCHISFDADPRGFAAHYNLDVAALIRHFNGLWQIKENRRLF